MTHRTGLGFPAPCRAGFPSLTTPQAGAPSASAKTPTRHQSSMKHRPARAELGSGRCHVEVVGAEMELREREGSDSETCCGNKRSPQPDRYKHAAARRCRRDRLVPPCAMGAAP